MVMQCHDPVDLWRDRVKDVRSPRELRPAEAAILDGAIGIGGVESDNHSMLKAQHGV